MKTIIVTTELGFISQLENYLTKVQLVILLLGLDVLKIAVLTKDLVLIKYIYAEALSFKTSSVGANAYKHILLYGGDLGDIPALPVLPAGPAPVVTSGGVIQRFRDIVQDTVNSKNITKDIMSNLGILAPESKEDNNLAKPEFHLTYSSAGHPMIVWIKGHFDGVEIWKSVDGINFTKLDKDIKPDYIDKSDLPPSTKAEKWYYKLIYFIDKDQVGQWSDVQSIAVAG